MRGLERYGTSQIPLLQGYCIQVHGAIVLDVYHRRPITTIQLTSTMISESRIDLTFSCIVRIMLLRGV